jgi:pilus assembly protein CpaF
MSAAAETSMVGRVRRRLVADRRDPSAGNVAVAVRAEHGVALTDRGVLELTGRLRSHIAGAGPLEELLADPEVTDVLVNGAQEVWADRGQGLVRLPPTDFPGDDLATPEALRRFVQRLAAGCGRRLDDANPCVDGRLPDGTRLHAVLPPISGRGVCLSLRTFRPTAFTLADLQARRALTDASAGLLRAIVQARLAFLITGGTGSGKTTLLNSLLGEVAPDERILIVEDAAELSPVHPHVIPLQGRPPNAEGAGEITLRDLVRQALRMRPDRIVVGECRGPEVVDLLAALNTGHDGGAGTLHANAASDVPARLEALAALGGLGRDAVHAQLLPAVRCLVHLVRRGGVRVVDAICVLDRDPATDRACVVPAWRHDTGPATGWPLLHQLLTDRLGAAPFPAVRS